MTVHAIDGEPVGSLGHKKPCSGSARRAFALVETLILIVIVGVALVALSETVVWSLKVRAASHADIDAYLLAQSWFETLEHNSPSDLTKNFDACVQMAGVALGGKFQSGEMWIRGMRFDAKRDLHEAEGFLRVTLTVRKPRVGDVMATASFSRNINLFSTETVPDNLNSVR
ncbi:MAG: type II secretion system protein [Fretibacterium sp.]|nr:type II secretion system protein [Fretibacterium sp.]